MASEKPMTTQVNASIEFGINGVSHAQNSYHHLISNPGNPLAGPLFAFSSRSALPITTTPTYRAFLPEKQANGLPRRLVLTETTLAHRYYLTKEDCIQYVRAMATFRALVRD